MLTSCCDLMRSNVITNPYEIFIALHMGLGMEPINYSHAPFTALFQKISISSLHSKSYIFDENVDLQLLPWGVLILLNFPHFSFERTQTWS